MALEKTKETKDGERAVDFTRPVQVARKGAPIRDDWRWEDCVIGSDGKTCRLGLEGEGAELEVRHYDFRNVPGCSIEEIDKWYQNEIDYLNEIRDQKIADFNERHKHMRYEGLKK